MKQICWLQNLKKNVKKKKKSKSSAAHNIFPLVIASVLLWILQYFYCLYSFVIFPCLFSSDRESESAWRWLRQREPISHFVTICWSASVTNSRAECLLSLNESLICCTMEMGRRVCASCCFLHQCLALSQAALHDAVLIGSNRSLKEPKPQAFTTLSSVTIYHRVIG